MGGDKTSLTEFNYTLHFSLPPPFFFCAKRRDVCAGIYYSVLAAVRPLLNLDVAAASCLSNCVSFGIEKILGGCNASYAFHLITGTCIPAASQ